MKPPIHWYGGKQKIINDLLPYIPPHECYVEPFGGAGAMLFAKEPGKVEIYNDLHKDVVNLYATLRNHRHAFMHYINLTPYSREELERCWEHLQIGHEPSIANARCFFTVARQSFSGRHNQKPGWSSSKKTNHALAWMNAIEGLPEVHERLMRVQIECLPASEVITKYDGKDTFQYLDPPYPPETRKEQKAYEHEMTFNEHFNLLCQIKNLKSMILISGYHCELYNDVLNTWHYKDLDHVASAINAKTDANTYRTETIWWNEALEQNRCGAQMNLGLEVKL